MRRRQGRGQEEGQRGREKGGEAFRWLKGEDVKMDERKGGRGKLCMLLMSDTAHCSSHGVSEHRLSALT